MVKRRLKGLHIRGTFFTFLFLFKFSPFLLTFPNKTTALSSHSSFFNPLNNYLKQGVLQVQQHERVSSPQTRRTGRTRSGNSSGHLRRRAQSHPHRTRNLQSHPRFLVEQHLEGDPTVSFFHIIYHNIYINLRLFYWTM